MNDRILINDIRYVNSIFAENKRLNSLILESNHALRYLLAGGREMKKIDLWYFKG